MDTEQIAVPAAVRAAFADYVWAAALSLANAVFQLAVHLNGWPVLLGAVLEAALLVGIARPMRAGRQWARTALLGVSGLFIGLGVLTLIALGGGLAQQGDLVKVALLLVGAKVGLAAVGIWNMYRPVNQVYFG